MNTAQKLEAITDEGNFERLVTSVLRKDNRDYAKIVHTGINVDGKPIACPVDGFCLIPDSDPPHFLMVQHTTTKKKDLKNKWLHDHMTVKIRKKRLSQRKTSFPSTSDDGDLLKAAREAEKLRKNFPKAKFTVILTTNRTLSKELMEKVYEKADKFGVSVDFWEQQRNLK